MAIFSIPIKPLSINEAFQGRRFKTKKYKFFEQAVSLLLPKHVNPVKGYIRVEYQFYLKNWKKIDVDNLLKPLNDILVANGIIEDDRKILKIEASKHKDEKDYISVQIFEIGKYSALWPKGEK